MASLNASDATNMPVALEPLDACAPNSQRNQENPMATEEDGSEKGSAEDEENERSPIDALIDPENSSSNSQQNTGSIEHQTNIEQIKSLKSLITNDEISNESSHHQQSVSLFFHFFSLFILSKYFAHIDFLSHQFYIYIQQSDHFDERRSNESISSKGNSPNDIMDHGENTGNSNTDETDINELDKIFGLDSQNGLTSSPSKGTWHGSRFFLFFFYFYLNHKII